LQPILAFENLRNWQSQLSTQIYNLRSSSQSFVTIITTNSTVIGDRFQSQLKYLPPKTLIIGDEPHNLGAPQLEESLPRNVGLRLPLSATPERYFDDGVTQSLFDYFAVVLQPEFNLQDAITKGALVHYLYYPVLVELTEAESLPDLKLTKKIGRSLQYRERENGDVGDFEDKQDIKSLLMQRARLISAA
jgi:superfamily II DNA or RNA helicase